MSPLAGAAAIAALALMPTSAAAAPACPNAVPVVHENNCMGAGSAGWRLSNYTESIAGYATKTSVNKGEDVVLKIARNGPIFPAYRVDVSVYRIGYYGGTGGRLIAAAGQTGVQVNNTFQCNPIDPVTGKLDCGNWQPTYTIPGSSLPASGVYVAKLRAQDTGGDSQIYFTVRDDNRNPESKILYQLPISTYQAYNNWGGKSLYWDKGSGSGETIAGTGRAVKVSFNRPFDALDGDRDRFVGPDYALIFWLEQQGYDVSYSDDVQTHLAGAELRDHDAVVISGHDEYWSREQYQAFFDARDAGVDVAGFGANTAYWKVRYEDGARTLVCYKTVEGTGSDGSGAAGVNDWGPDGSRGTADDAVGPDGQAGTADDKPENATTTWRDNGAPAGDPNAPPEGRVGPNRPENSLFGVMFVGGDLQNFRPLQIPAQNGAGEFSGDRLWRNTGIPTNQTTSIGQLVGWEWDAIPTQSQYVAQQPSGVKRLTNSSIGGSGPIWIQDEGRVYGPTPPPGQPGSVQAVKYTASSGALVFAAGTLHWSYGLSFAPDARISQATYNLFSDMGVQPGTPSGVVLDDGGPPANQAPTASITATPDPAQVGQTVSFDASGSSDPDGQITRYEWDLDGNGSFETDTGTTATTSRSYAAPDSIAVRVRVTDNGSATGEAVRTVTILGQSSGSYTDTVLATPGLLNYWRMGETAGSVFADIKGGRHATAAGGPALGRPGALGGDTNASAGFDGLDDAATASLDLSGASRLTLEFWLRWNAYSDDDDLAFEFTPNFNNGAGGFLVDPNAPQLNGSFGVGIGNGLSRNNAFFGRPSANAWHHYALVLDTLALASNQITPYVDGVPVSYTKTASGIGAGNFANSTLAFMSRNAEALFGAGDLDEVAIYDRALTAATVADHYSAGLGNRTPTSSFTVTPNPAAVGQTVTFDGSASSDQDGAIARYEWDLDGNGSFETDTGATPSASRSYSQAGTVAVQLRVTDNQGASGASTRNLTVGSTGVPPTASFTISPSPAQAGAATTFDGAASSDPDGTIVKYEWDLDGNGSYETDTGATASASRTYPSPDSLSVGLRVTDNSGRTGTATRQLSVVGSGNAPYNQRVQGTPGLANYWRMGESAGTTLADSAGSSPATLAGAALGSPGSPGGGANTSASFDGADDWARATLNLADTSKLTLEFWLQWDAFANDDDLAFEFTPNFNQNTGGFLVDPNAPQEAGRFGVGIGSGASRNNAFFARPSANAWHHYALVLDSSAPGGSQITPYVDGVAVPYTKTASGTGAGSFAASDLYFMSRAASGLFGAGDLDEVAIYKRALGATTIADHYGAAAANSPPTASFTVTPSAAQTRQSVSFNGAASSDSDGTIAQYAWDLDGNGSYETSTGTTSTTTRTYDTPGTYTIGLRVTDNGGATTSTTRSLTITSAYAAQVTGTSGLRGYWRLGDSGLTAADSSGSGAGGSYVGGPTVFGPLIAGELNNSRNFDGNNDYVNSTPTPLGTPTRVSAEAWVRTDTTKSSSSGYHFLVTDSNVEGSDGFALAVNSSNRVIFVVNSTIATSSATLTPGTTYHVAGTYDGTRVRVYVNGVESGSVAFTGSISWSGSRDLNLARQHGSNNRSLRYLDGKLDEAAVYNLALPATTILNHYNAGRP